MYSSVASQVINKARRRGLPVITRVQRRPVLIVRTGGQDSRRVARPRSRPVLRVNLGHQPSQNNRLLDILGIAPNSIGPQFSVGHSHQPPGVSFLGGQRLSGQVGQYIPPQSLPILTNSVPQHQLPIVFTGTNNVIGQTGVHIPAMNSVQVPPSSGSNIIPGSNGLEIGGLTPKGELLIRGRGGTITIGRDLLHGISQNNAFPLLTEFEEFEAEGAPRGAHPNQNINSIKLTEPGRGSIVINNSGTNSASSANSASSSSGSSAGSSTGIIEVINAGSNAQSFVAPLASSSSSASSSASHSSASSSSSSSSASASSGGSGKPTVALGNGFSVESGGNSGSGKVIRLGDTAGKTQVITMGGSKGHIQLTDGGTGLQVPGNATFIV